VTKSLNCRNESFRKIQPHLYFQLLVYKRRKPGNEYSAEPCVKMSPQYVIHVTALSSGLATGATRSSCNGATDLFTFQDHLTQKMCCVNNRVSEKLRRQWKPFSTARFWKNRSQDQLRYFGTGYFCGICLYIQWAIFKP
jgi:hypothetical protein